VIIVEQWAADQLASRAAIWIAEHVWGAVARHGRADIAVSGGSTPAVMLEQLAALPLPWRDLHVWQVDERCVPDDHPDRNIHQLAPLVDIGVTIHPLPVTASDLDAAAEAFIMPSWFDVVHLGVGDDGHSASWPPDQSALWLHATLPLIATDEFRGHRRLTITPRVVHQARHVLVLASGQAKQPVLTDWVAGRSTLPIAQVRSATLLTDCDIATS
jgi:6-phosphogluconolactonase